MILLSGFLDVLFRALVFIGLALSVGGVAFRYFVLRPLEKPDSLRRAASLISIGAFAVAISQLLALAQVLWTLADAAGRWPVADFLATDYARAGLVRAALAFSLVGLALGLRSRPESAGRWGVTALLAMGVMASGAWLVHGASRTENAAALMAVTVLHQLGAIVWIGGIMHLTAQWRLLRRSPDSLSSWPPLASRFSPLALGSVALLLAAGVYLAWEYIHRFQGLIGSAYGAMLLTKIALMGALLFLGGMNNLALRRWKATGDSSLSFQRLPPFAEAESGLGAVVLMVAAALTGQPPAVDIPGQWATSAEVLHAFAPKMPRLIAPPHARMLAGAASSLDPFGLPTALQKIQSDFNHNISGILVILVGLAALINRATRTRRARRWPLLFLLLAGFLIVIGEPNGWPLGPEPFWSTLLAPEVLQHRLATLIVAALGQVVWRAETGAPTWTRWHYLLPLLSAVGGTLLLTHSHSIYATKWAFLIETSHNAIGALAVIAGAAGWLELRTSGRESRIAGLIWPTCFVLIGVVLLFYREI